MFTGRKPPDEIRVKAKFNESKDLKEIDSALEVINEAWKNASEEVYKAQAQAQADSSKTKGDSKSKSNKKPKDNGDNVQDVDFEEVK